MASVRDSTMNLNDDSPSQPLCPLLAPPRHEPSSWWIVVTKSAKSTCALPLPHKNNRVPLAHFLLQKPSISSWSKNHASNLKKTLRSSADHREVWWGLPRDVICDPVFVEEDLTLKWGHPTFARHRRRRWGGLPAKPSCEFWSACTRSRRASHPTRSKSKRSPCSWASSVTLRIEVFTTGSKIEKPVRGRSSRWLPGPPVEWPGQKHDMKIVLAETRWTTHRIVIFDELVYLVNTVWVTLMEFVSQSAIHYLTRIVVLNKEKLENTNRLVSLDWLASSPGFYNLCPVHLSRSKQSVVY